MEGNPIIAAIMLCTMVCMAIWPVFLLGLVAAGVLAYCHQWIAAAVVGVPSLWIVACWLIFVAPYCNKP